QVKSLKSRSLLTSSGSVRRDVNDGKDWRRIYQRDARRYTFTSIRSVKCTQEGKCLPAPREGKCCVCCVVCVCVCVVCVCVWCGVCMCVVLCGVCMCVVWCGVSWL